MNQKIHRRDFKNDAGLLALMAKTSLENRCLITDFTNAVRAAADRIDAPVRARSTDQDLRDLPWCSIDNDRVLEADQLTVALSEGNGICRILVAVADVAELIPLGSEIDRHAFINTATVYTTGCMFPMIPERLSTDLTSLVQDADRAAIVTDMAFDDAGGLVSETIYPALVRNRASLTYSAVVPWFRGEIETPEAISAVSGLAENLLIQSRIAGLLRRSRDQSGALRFETAQGEAILDEKGNVVSLSVRERNEASAMIEEFMIAANCAAARFLMKRGYPMIRRIIPVPGCWEKFIAIAKGYRVAFPDKPDQSALSKFLFDQRTADPERFPDLSRTVIRWLGNGRYAAWRPGTVGTGHFGLAVSDYVHSTAPNRRYGDLIMQRILKAALAGEESPYPFESLAYIATHLSTRESSVSGICSESYLSAAALLMHKRIGERFRAVVTDVGDSSKKGIRVRVLSLPIEGFIKRGKTGLKTRDIVDVKLVNTDFRTGEFTFRVMR